ncbi:hypothetical protein [Acidomonas methanolica]|uniref:Uncharacterized protein n=1 Tax=Acidomonas methanolica NBRC 104435 TaxID=1231351 RepID=A0A023D8E2_ACIMT|nr:hypothetical protein [Acidomonas methanolica]MBU2652770.1 hypothetical protein [Acidomonas methanolica]TCS31173.1 hypothetical protein EDC31_10314 [Acidomonas methanolica]GAJ30076.1 hypothetical protein Amme_102_011 [Acidomonas methanolica NBRC 104435]GBQ51127.1 hypothetical protein AA0498_1391 [Acidomonas methanolica]GEK98579.1 hypothetical protein AME01nite_10780 [Acidomonas methanolica NBRC 104435]
MSGSSSQADGRSSPVLDDSASVYYEAHGSGGRQSRRPSSIEDGAERARAVREEASRMKDINRTQQVLRDVIAATEQRGDPEIQALYAQLAGQLRSVPPAIGTDRLTGEMTSVNRTLGQMLSAMRETHDDRVAQRTSESESKDRKKIEDRTYIRAKLQRQRDDIGTYPPAELRENFASLLEEVREKSKVGAKPGAAQIAENEAQGTLGYYSQYRVRRMHGWMHNKRKVTAALLPGWYATANTICTRYANGHTELTTLLNGVLAVPVEADVPAWDLKMEDIKAFYKMLEDLIDQTNKLVADIREKSATNNAYSLGKIAFWLTAVASVVAVAGVALRFA